MSSIATLLTFGLPVACYFLVRPIKARWQRGSITAITSLVILLYIAKDLPLNQLSSMMAITFHWLFSIRLLHLLTLPSVCLATLSFLDYIKQFLWILMPISRNLKPRPMLYLLKEDTIPQIIIVILKIWTSSWIRDWMLQCLHEEGDGAEVSLNYVRYMSYTLMFASYILTADYPTCNILPAFVSVVTLDRYSVLPFNNWAVLSNSPRVFWGQRYNKIVNKILKESVFYPLKDAGFSSSFAAFLAFFVSGLLHLHVAHIVFGHGAVAALLFFLIQGVACAVDAKLSWNKWPKAIGWATNMGVLAVSLPLYMGLFIQASPGWLLNSPSQIPVPQNFALSVSSVCF